MSSIMIVRVRSGVGAVLNVTVQEEMCLWWTWWFRL